MRHNLGLGIMLYNSLEAAEDIKTFLQNINESVTLYYRSMTLPTI
jgi:hypothetical protein